jgi:UDP-N-acetylmuramate dehydrogenase
VVRARFGLRADELAAIQSRIAAVDGGIGGWRTRCAAPAFHAPSGHNAATLLADAGCQGMKVGGAQISNQLANAIVTGRVASSSDVLELCCNVVDRVRERCRVTLQPSLWFVDERGQRLVG